MLKKLKTAAFSVARSTRLLNAVGASKWRRNRLLLLGYHGIALEDEHEWDPELYLSPQILESRLELLKRERCTVLPLGDALRALEAGTLPERSVALTFDDGYYDFLKKAFPLLESYGASATVYLTTHYSLHNRPVFEVTCSYLAWKGRNRRLSPNTIGCGDGPSFDLAGSSVRGAAVKWLHRFAASARLSSEERDDLARRIAVALGIDYDELRTKRLLHLLQPQEVAQLAARGVAFELHTHRHRMPPEHDAFAAEVEDNRRAIVEMTGITPTHFCYPGGLRAPRFFPWLREFGIVSATTCRPGIATRNTNPFDLPRLIDTGLVSSLAFSAWLSGFASIVPRRRRAGSPVLAAHRQGRATLGSSR